MPPIYDHSRETIESLIDEIKCHGIEFSVDQQVRDAKANTKHSPVPEHETPLVVFLPQSTKETSLILKSCNDRRIAVTSVRFFKSAQAYLLPSI